MSLLHFVVQLLEGMYESNEQAGYFYISQWLSNLKVESGSLFRQYNKRIVLVLKLYEDKNAFPNIPL